MDEENTPSEDVESAMFTPVFTALSALPALADTSLKAPVALRVMPLLYAGLPLLLLLQSLYSGFCAMRYSFVGGCWILAYGIVLAFFLLLVLRVALECAAKYLRN